MKFWFFACLHMVWVWSEHTYFILQINKPLLVSSQQELSSFKNLTAWPNDGAPLKHSEPKQAKWSFIWYFPGIHSNTLIEPKTKHHHHHYPSHQLAYRAEMKLPHPCLSMASFRPNSLSVYQCPSICKSWTEFTSENLAQHKPCFSKLVEVKLTLSSLWICFQISISVLLCVFCSVPWISNIHKSEAHEANNN